MAQDEKLDLTPAAYAVHQFGGVGKLAETLGLKSATISHWLHGQGPEKTGLGDVPARYQRVLLQKAKIMGLTLTPWNLIYGGTVKGMRILVPKK